MTSMIHQFGPNLIVCLTMIVFAAGVIKGIVGFAMPMMILSGASLFVSPDIALAILIAPTFVANFIQALRYGIHDALAAARRFWVFLCVGLIFLIIGANFLTYIRHDILLILIGFVVVLFSILQQIGSQFTIPKGSKIIEAIFATIAGFIGGFSGVWGPPTVTYLTAINTPKREQIIVQGVIYSFASVALVGAHFGSGVLNAKTIPISVFMVIPAIIGMVIGTKIQQRFDQDKFRQVTLRVLMIVGLYLIVSTLLKS